LLTLAAVPVFAQHNGNSQDHNVAICHKGRTIHIAAPAVPAHIRHGDTEGACSVGTATVTPTTEGTPTGTPEATPTDTVEATATDTAEATATDTPEPTATDTPEPTLASGAVGDASNGPGLAVCHHGRTIYGSFQVAAAHLRHGDAAGPC
jgi:hypothetical protein